MYSELGAETLGILSVSHQLHREVDITRQE